MQAIEQLFANNRAWAEKTRARTPDFFEQLAEQQSPPYLWIGCADSRVPSSQVVGLKPGELFVHRNVANVVAQSDLNGLSVLQYAVDALKVEHVIVCGHYGCGGVQAAAQNVSLGVIDDWLRHVKAVAQKHAEQLAHIPDETERLRRLCELNVIEQVANVGQTPIVRDAWARGQALTVHGWIYGLADGLLHDLDMSASTPEELSERYAAAVPGA